MERREGEREGGREGGRKKKRVGKGRLVHFLGPEHDNGGTKCFGTLMAIRLG